MLSLHTLSQSAITIIVGPKASNCVFIFRIIDSDEWLTCSQLLLSLGGRCLFG